MNIIVIIDKVSILLFQFFTYECICNMIRFTNSAAEELARSPNSKIVMLGSKQGLSVMLDTK